MARVALIGAGLIGRAWAIVFAQAGWEVALYDAEAAAADRALAGVADGLEALAAHGLVEDPQSAATRVRLAADVGEAVPGASFVQESVPETVEAKRAIFHLLDRLAPREAVLASSSSAIVPSLFTESLAGRDRCLVAHPVNPPHLVPLVELVASPWTAPETITRAKSVYEAVGQVPILVRREIEGFVLNRLQGALLAEAFRLVGEGYASPQDVDKAVKDGLALRWSFMGPFETIELNAPGGIADYCARYAPFYRRLQADAARPSVYDERSVAGILDQWGAAPTVERIAARMRWRDRRLAALKAHKAAQAPQ